jgi:hypothetical protein
MLPQSLAVFLLMKFSVKQNAQGINCWTSILLAVLPLSCKLPYKMAIIFQNGNHVLAWQSTLEIHPNHTTTVPLVLNTSTGLSHLGLMIPSPQLIAYIKTKYHQIGQNYSKQTPPDQASTYTLHSSWTNNIQEPMPEPPSRPFSTVCFINEVGHLQSLSPPPDSSDTTLPPNTVSWSPPDSSSQSTSTEEGIVTSPSSLSLPFTILAPSSSSTSSSHLKRPIIRTNWNPNHQYSTHFKKTIQANTAVLQEVLK